MSDTTPPTATPTRGASRILDRRYQRYTGPRKGEAHATWRLTVHVFYRLLGLRRPFRYKIVPILLLLFCFAFPVGLIAIAAFVPGGGNLGSNFGYAPLFSIISLPIFLFVVITAPNPLITDRNNKSLSLYLASPLTRNTYLVAQAAAVAAVLAIVTIGPLLLYFISTVIQGAGPDGLAGFGSDLGKIVLAGGFLAIYYAAITMVAGAFAERPSIAAAAIFIGLSAVTAVTEPLARRFDSDLIRLLSIGDLDDHIVFRIFDFEPFQAIDMKLSTVTIVLAAFGWVAVFLGATWWRYNRLVISR